MFGAAGFGGFVDGEIVCGGAFDEVGQVRRGIGFWGAVVAVDEARRNRC